jgi:hypothetical protein
MGISGMVLQKWTQERKYYTLVGRNREDVLIYATYDQAQEAMYSGGFDSMEEMPVNEHDDPFCENSKTRKEFAECRD